MKFVSAKNLRIAKLYVNKITGAFDFGGTASELVHAVPFYVLLVVKGKRFMVVPTEKLKINGYITADNNKPYALTVLKTHKNNRYRKPVTLCADLEDKFFNKNDLLKFAEKVEQVDATNYDYMETEKQLGKICFEMNEMVKGEIDDLFCLD